MWTVFHLESLLIAIIFTSILCAPIVHFLVVGLPHKSNDIINSLSTEAKTQYLALYQKRKCTSSEAEKNFEEYYWKWYGPRHLIPALVLVSVVSLLGCYHLGETALNWIFKENEFQKLPTVAVAGFIGGYIFVAWDFIDRNARRDMSSSDIYRGALRLSTSIAIGWIFSKLAAPALGPFIAFGVGVFPLPTVQILIKRLFNRQLQIDSDPTNIQEPVIKIAGVNNDIADRLSDADVSTISQLAYCDPIRVTMHTNLGFIFVNDIVSQALAWIYLEDKLNELRKFGLRGACEIEFFMSEIKDATDIPTKTALDERIAEFSATTNISLPAIKNCFEQISLDPYTLFLVEAYG